MWEYYFSPSHFVFEARYAAWLKDTIFGVHVSPGSAETLVRRSGITNHHLIAYSLSNISAKNYRNRLMYVEAIVWGISVVFWDAVYVWWWRISIRIRSYRCCSFTVCFIFDMLQRCIHQCSAGSETRYCFTCISHLQLFADKSLEINEQKVKLSITETWLLPNVVA